MDGVNVTIGDSHQRFLLQDDGIKFGWRTEDPLLQQILLDLSLVLKEPEAMENLPYAIKEIYPGGLIAWDWTEDESLKMIARPETDLKNFAGMIRNQVNEVVLFEKTSSYIWLKKAFQALEKYASTLNHGTISK